MTTRATSKKQAMASRYLCHRLDCSNQAVVIDALTDRPYCTIHAEPRKPETVAECYGTEDDYCPFDQTPGAHRRGVRLK